MQILRFSTQEYQQVSLWNSQHHHRPHQARFQHHTYSIPGHKLMQMDPPPTRMPTIAPCFNGRSYQISWQQTIVLHHLPGSTSKMERCDVTHSIKRRRDGQINQLCLEEKCDRSFLICRDHDNKQHPYRSTAGIWMKKINNSYPELKLANAVEEVAMLANFPGETSETPDFTDLAQKAFESFIN